MSSTSLCTLFPCSHSNKLSASSTSQSLKALEKQGFHPAQPHSAKGSQYPPPMLPYHQLKQTRKGRIQTTKNPHTTFLIKEFIAAIFFVWLILGDILQDQRDFFRLAWLFCGIKKEKKCCRELLPYTFFEQYERKKIKNHLKMKSIQTKGWKAHNLFFWVKLYIDEDSMSLIDFVDWLRWQEVYGTYCFPFLGCHGFSHIQLERRYWGGLSLVWERRGRKCGFQLPCVFFG